MAFSNALGNTLAAFLLNGTAIPANYTNASWYLSLHTGDPGLGGTQATNEIAYTGYARQPLVRNTTSEFTVSVKVGSNAVAAQFPVMSGGAGGIATYLGIGELVSGTGILFTSTLLTTSVNVQTNVQVHFPIGSIVLTFA